MWLMFILMYILVQSFNEGSQYENNWKIEGIKDLADICLSSNPNPLGSRSSHASLDVKINGKLYFTSG